MLTRFSAPGPSTVVFTLKYAYAPFLQRLTRGVLVVSHDPALLSRWADRVTEVR